jgi:hypothetical protein
VPGLAPRKQRQTWSWVPGRVPSLRLCGSLARSVHVGVKPREHEEGDVALVFCSRWPLHRGKNRASFETSRPSRSELGAAFPQPRVAVEGEWAGRGQRRASRRAMSSFIWLIRRSSDLRGLRAPAEFELTSLPAFGPGVTIGWESGLPPRARREPGSQGRKARSPAGSSAAGRAYPALEGRAFGGRPRPPDLARGESARDNESRWSDPPRWGRSDPS